MHRTLVPAAFGIMMLGTVVSAGASLSLQVPPGWTIGDQQEIPGTLSILELVREGESVDDWEGLVTVETMPRPKAFESADRFLQKVRSVRENRCPGVTAWTVVSQETKRLVYEYSMAEPCGDTPRESEIGLILLGKKDIWRIRYTTRLEAIPADERATWLETFAKAHVRKN